MMSNIILHVGGQVQGKLFAKQIHTTTCSFFKNYYDILNVKPNAGNKEIKTAYYEKAKKFHPDANLGDSSTAVKFKEISEAYEILSDPEKRTNFDKDLHAKGYTDVRKSTEYRGYTDRYRREQASPISMAHIRYTYETLNRERPDFNPNSDHDYQGGSTFNRFVYHRRWDPYSKQWAYSRRLNAKEYENYIRESSKAFSWFPRKTAKVTLEQVLSLLPSYQFTRFFSTTFPTRMFIQVEETPNPNSIKFYPGKPVLEDGTIDFTDKAEAALKSPLAKALFKINGVKSIFFASEYITVTKEEDTTEWNVLKPQIFTAIMIFYTMDQPILYEPRIDSSSTKISPDDSDVVKQIKELIETRIKPTIQEDGGDIEFVSYEDYVVKVKLQGACTSCPSSTVTLQSGIKNMLRFYIPEIADVEQEI